jgi:uncharacterized protein DUF3551
MKPLHALSVALILPSLAAFDARPAASEIYRPWCAQYYGGNGNGTTNCGFVSYDQCMMTATPGSGAWCVQNPFYLQYGGGPNGESTRRVYRRSRS